MKLGFTLFQRVRGKLLPTSEAITLFEKAQSIYQTSTTCACWPTTRSRSARQDHFRLSAKPGLSPVPELVTDFISKTATRVMTLTTEHTETLVKNWICAR